MANKPKRTTKTEATSGVSEAKKDAKDAKMSAASAKKAALDVKAELAQIQATSKLKGFMSFVREQGVIGLAVGLAIGTQAGATVKAIVEGFITPLVAFIVGSGSALQNAKWFVVGRDTNEVNYWLTLGNRELVFAWGSVLSSLITLLAVAAVIYFVVKGLNLDKLDKKKDA